MKPSELRDKSDDELRELETELRDKLLRLRVAQATQRTRNSARFGQVRRDIARVLTILNERKLGLATAEDVAQSEG